MQGFSGLLSPKTMLSGALAHTISTYSEAVDGQRCGQAAYTAIHVAHHQTKIFFDKIQPFSQNHQCLP
jgi:cysteinyl-tRNA synthetase